MLQVEKNCLLYQLKLLPKEIAGIYVRDACRRRGVAKRDRLIVKLSLGCLARSSNEQSGDNGQKRNPIFTLAIVNIL